MIRRIAGLHLTSDARVRRWTQYCYFAAAPLLLITAVRAVTRFATSPFEILVGIVAAATLALLMILVGLVLPLTARRDA